ncbi:MAG: hypothetical protein OXI24_17955 [Candidatus Poribacteria bacterium]|nr:hypothetical protein [Candidatus Poribacteria bacterium]
MKMSSCPMIAIVCILAVGLLTTTSFLPNISADPSEVTHYIYTTVTICTNGGFGSGTSSSSQSTYASGWHEGVHVGGNSEDLVPWHEVTINYYYVITYSYEYCEYA